MRRVRATSEDGFTLLEALLALTISVIITGAIAAAFIIVLKANTAVETRAEHSHDAQLLAAYFPGDVVSGTPNGVDTSAATTSGCLTTPAASTNVVQLTWTDKATNTGYVADYRANASTGTDGKTVYSLLRLTCSGATPANVSPTAQIVARGLASLTSAVATPSALDATVTMKVVDSDGYTFSITGSQRVGPDHHERALGAYDTNGNGKVDLIKMSFNGIVTSNCLPGFSASLVAGTGSFTPGSAVIDSIDATTADLPINEGSTVTTAVGAMTASFAIQDGCKLVAFSGTPTDKMPPVVQSVAGFDNNANGKFDTVIATYSEPVNTVGAAADWTVTGIPSGGTFTTSNAVAASGSTAVLSLTEGSGSKDTAVGSMQVSGGPVTDAAGNGASPVTTAQPVLDKAAPILVSLTTQDVGPTVSAPVADGYVDHLQATFTEPIATPASPAGGWSTASAPSGSTCCSGTYASVSGGNLEVALSVGGGSPNTAVPSTMTVTMSNGASAKDAAGNSALTFSGVKPADGAGPMAIALTTNDAGGTQGRAESGDSVSVSFSEPLVGLPPQGPPATMTFAETHGVTSNTWSATGGGITLTSSSGLDNTCISVGTATAPATLTVTPTGTPAGTDVQVTLTLTAAPSGGTIGTCGKATLTFVPATSGGLTDAAGNPLAGSTYSTPSTQKFM